MTSSRMASIYAHEEGTTARELPCGFRLLAAVVTILVAAALS